MKNRNRRKAKPIRNAVNPLRIDPTRTITLRRLFAAEIKKRFRRLRFRIHQYVSKWEEPTANAFCPTGAGGGLDNSCPPGGKEAAEKSIKDAPNEKFSGDPDNKYGTYIKVPFEVDETKSGAALADKLRDIKPVEASVPVSSLIATQPLLQREALQWMLKKGIEQVDRGEGPAVVRAGGKHYLADGNHRSSVAKFEGRESLKVRLYDLDKAGVTVNAPGWRAMRDPERVKAFQVWLEQQVDSEVLKDADRLFEKYAQLGFKKGAGRAFDDVKAKRWGKGEGDFYKGSRDQFLKDTFAQPVAVDKIKLLAGRSYDDLEGVTEAMSTRMSRSLTDGLVQGKSPRDIADDLVDDVDDIGEDRALTIARTEIIRAHADGQLEALGNLGVEEVGVAIEWSTTGDEKVCPKCRPMEGVILTLEEAAGLIPRHPNCRCAWIPVVQKEPGKKDTKTLIDEAIDQSLEASGEKDSWPGAELDVDEKRPKSILDNSEQGFIDYLMNAFCPTGPGGGVDPTCSPGDSKGAAPVISTTTQIAMKLADEARKDPDIRLAAEKFPAKMEAEDKRLNDVRNRVTAVKARVALARANMVKQQNKLDEIYEQRPPMDQRWKEGTERDVDNMNDPSNYTPAYAKWKADFAKQEAKVLDADEKWRTKNKEARETALKELRGAAAKQGEVIENVYTKRDMKLSDASRDEVTKGEVGLRGMLSKVHQEQIDKTKVFPIQPGLEQRAYFLDAKFTGTQSINLADYKGNVSPAQTYVHELGHALEQNPKVREAATGFLYSRVGKGETAKWMGPGYGEREVGFDDEFAKAFTPTSGRYVGKFYADGNTEVVSMGMERLFMDPIGFATADPHYFKFVVGVMDGSLLK